MKGTLLLVLAAMFALHAQAVQAQAVNKPAVQAAIIANEKAINDAFMKGDLKTFHSYVTPDGLGVDGMGPSKVSDMDAMMADYKVQNYTISVDQFMWINDTTVVHIYRWMGKATYKGQPAPNDVWSSTVWTNKGGKWLGAFHQESVTMPPPAPPAAPKAPAPVKK